MVIAVLLQKHIHYISDKQTSLSDLGIKEYLTCALVDYTPPSPLILPQAVFRMYDTDHSGSISMEEFETISSNFPFIENFSVLDQDKLVT